VTVTTSDVKRAGTDATVYCRIHGSTVLGNACCTSLLKLESSKDNFERGQVDKFVVEGLHVHSMERVEIGHDNKGMFADWHLKMVEVFDPKGSPGGVICTLCWELMLSGCRSRVKCSAANLQPEFMNKSM
jgi:hypothetical protein